jgi:hypothetical protein
MRDTDETVANQVNEVIEVDEEDDQQSEEDEGEQQEKEENKKRKAIAPSSEVWDRFTKVKTAMEGKSQVQVRWELVSL